MRKILLLTGPSGVGKTTIATELQFQLFNPAIVLDGDHVRKHLSNFLTWSKEDRLTQANLLTAVALALAPRIDVIIAAIFPFDESRIDLLKRARDEKISVTIVALHASEKTLRERDTKGLYRTDAKQPYEVPIRPAANVDTENFSVDHCVGVIITAFEMHAGPQI
jgi:adenylylsulfate kinase